MIPVLTTMSATKVKVEWKAPNSGSLNIIRYFVEVLGSDGVKYFESSSCNG